MVKPSDVFPKYRIQELSKGSQVGAPKWLPLPAPFPKPLTDPFSEPWSEPFSDPFSEPLGVNFPSPLFLPGMWWRAIGKLTFTFTLVSTWWALIAFVNGGKS